MTDIAIRTPNIPFAAPQLSAQREHLMRAGDRLWRVLDRSGRILGHLRAVPDPRGVRYRAERLMPAAGSFRIIGEFWSADDAASTLRNG